MGGGDGEVGVEADGDHWGGGGVSDGGEIGVGNGGLDVGEE